MVAASEGYRIVEPITLEEAQYRWECETCNARASLVRIERNQDNGETRFLVNCANGRLTNVDMTYEFRLRRPSVLRFRHLDDRREAVTEATNETIRCRCLSGCGHATWISQQDLARDGRIV